MGDENASVIVRQWVDEVLNDGRLDAAGRLLSEDVVFHHAGVPQPLRGVEAVTRLVAGLRAAFPDLHSPILDLTAQDDRVSVRFRWRGTHCGEFQGCAPTQRPVTVHGSALYRVRGGRIAEAWADFDTVGLMRQLGETVAIGDSGVTG